MGGVSRSAPGGVGRGVDSLGAGRCAAEIPQAPPRPEEAEAQEAERGQDQTRGHREDSRSASYMYKMTPPRGLAQPYAQSHTATLCKEFRQRQLPEGKRVKLHSCTHLSKGHLSLNKWLNP